jgi:hypothetical protein
MPRRMRRQQRAESLGARFAARRLLVLVWLAASCMSASAALPPKYLSVPDFDRCLSQADAPGGTYRTWCLPPSKAAACPAASWKQLRALTGQQALPPCPARIHR